MTPIRSKSRSIQYKDSFRLCNRNHTTTHLTNIMGLTHKNNKVSGSSYKLLSVFAVFALVFINVQVNRVFAQAAVINNDSELDVEITGSDRSGDSVRNEIQFELPILVNKGLSGNANAKIVSTVSADVTHTEVFVSAARLQALFKNYANDEQINTWFGPDIKMPQAIGLQGSTTSVAILATVGEESKEEVDQQSVLNSQSKENDYISLQNLRDRGLNISFDSALLSINATIPRLGSQTLSLQGRRNSVPDDIYSQAKISSGLNFRARNTYQHRPTPANPDGFGDTSIDLDGFTTFGGFGGWSLYYGALYDEGRDVKFLRRDVTLIHDSFKSGVRYSFGDFVSTSSGLQSSASLLGVNIERRYEQINPSRNIRPSGRSTFTLERDSLVTFEVNGRIADTRPVSYTHLTLPTILPV